DGGPGDVLRQLNERMRPGQPLGLGAVQICPKGMRPVKVPRGLDDTPLEMQCERGDRKNGPRGRYTAGGAPLGTGGDRHAVPEGTWTTYFPPRAGKSGIRESVTHWVHGLREGICERWDADGNRIAETTYRHGHPVGEAKSWHSSGVLQ